MIRETSTIWDCSEVSYLGEFATAITTRIRSGGSWMFSALTLCNIPTLPFLDPSDCRIKSYTSSQQLNCYQGKTTQTHRLNCQCKQMLSNSTQWKSRTSAKSQDNHQTIKLVIQENQTYSKRLKIWRTRYWRACCSSRTPLFWVRSNDNQCVTGFTSSSAARCMSTGQQAAHLRYFYTEQELDLMLRISKSLIFQKKNGGAVIGKDTKWLTSRMMKILQPRKYRILLCYRVCKSYMLAVLFRDWNNLQKQVNFVRGVKLTSR